MWFSAQVLNRRLAALPAKMKLSFKTFRRVALGVLFAAAVVIASLTFRPAAVGSLVGLKTEAAEEVTAVKRNMTFWVEAAGVLRATSVRNFGGPPEFADYWQFQIVNIAPEGKAVKKGDLLVSFDSQRMQQDLQTFQGESQQAAKELEKTKAQIDLEQQELASRIAEAENKHQKIKLKQVEIAGIRESSKIELDALELEQSRRERDALKERLDWHKKSSEANLKIIAGKKVRAENKVNLIKQGMENFQAKADRDGVVVYKTKWNGERFSVGENIWSGQSILEIPDLNTIIAEALVPEVDVGKVKIGQRAEVSIDAFPGKSYAGHVKSMGTLVRPKAWDIPNRVLETRIVLEQLDTSVMRPAMSVKVKIEVATAEDCIAVPLKAVLTTAEGSVVKVKTETGWKRVPVTVGRSNGVDVIVQEGLSQGDRFAADFSKAR